MTGLAIAVAVLTALLYVALRRVRPRNHGYVGILDGLGVQIMPSRYVRPGDLLLIRRAAVAVEWIDVSVVREPPGADAARASAEARIGLQVTDPTAFVRITGI